MVSLGRKVKDREMKQPGALGTVCCPLRRSRPACESILFVSAARSLGKPGCLLPVSDPATRLGRFSLSVSVGLRRSVRLLSGLLVLFSLPAYLPRVVLWQCLSACVSSCFKAFGWLPWFKGEGQRPRPCRVWTWPALLPRPQAALCLSHPQPHGLISLNVPLTHTHTTADVWAHDLQARPRVLHESYVMVETASMVGPAIIPISAKALEALEWPAESLRSRSHQVA